MTTLIEKTTLQDAAQRHRWKEKGKTVPYVPKPSVTTVVSVMDEESVSKVTNPVERRLLTACAEQQIDVAHTVREWLEDGHQAWCSTAERIVAAIDSGPSRNTPLGEAWREWLSVDVDEATWRRVLQAATESLPKHQGREGTRDESGTDQMSRIESDLALLSPLPPPMTMQASPPRGG